MVDVSRVILGTANFGNKYGPSGGLDHSQCHDILDAAYDLGIRWVETAYSYGLSRSHIGNHKHATSFNIICKGDSKQEYQKCKQVLPNIKEFLLHHFHTKWSILVFDGASIYTPDEMANVVSAKPYATLELPLNLVDQTFSKLIGQRIHKTIARSVFLRGLAWQAPPVFGIPFAHLCWNYIIHHPRVSHYLVGVDSPEQLQQILTIPTYEIDYSIMGEGEWIKSSR